jgi:hypothetical protein
MRHVAVTGPAGTGGEGEGFLLEEPLWERVEAEFPLPKGKTEGEDVLWERVRVRAPFGKERG